MKKMTRRIHMKKMTRRIHMNNACFVRILVEWNVTPCSLFAASFKSFFGMYISYINFVYFTN